MNLSLDVSDRGTSGGTLVWTRLPQEHALLVARGPSGPAMVDEMRCCLATGVRYVVVDLSAMTTCSRPAVTALAEVGRVVQERGGWLRAVATASCVLTAIEQATLAEAFALYRAGADADVDDSAVVHTR